MKNNRLSIGQMAELNHTTLATLRLYDENGLLKPVNVDPTNGYRIFGPGGSGHHALTKTQMAKVIDAQSKEIDELKKDNADKDKRIDALEQKMTEILAKLDKSKD